MGKFIKVDSHQHFWQPKRGDYGWLTEDLTHLYKDFLPKHLHPYLDNTGINKTVLVQAAPTLEETHYLLQLAKETDFIAGVVGWIDMENSSATDDLEALAQNPLFVGIRPMIQDISDVDWMLRPELQSIYDTLAGMRLCFDALVLPKHLPNLYTLLRRHPNLKVVIDHGAKPSIANGDFQPWADEIKNISEKTNAYCKLSGLLTEAGEKPDYEKIQPYMQHLLDCFGAERLIWGSDWPVLELTSDYRTWHKLSLHFLQNLSSEEQTKILGGNAQTFYELNKNI